MTLSDLDHAISTLENSATADAVSETLEFLRGLRERAVEGCVDKEATVEACDGVEFFMWPAGLGMRPALLILAPEDS